jgi:hypothetical protein
MIAKTRKEENMSMSPQDWRDMARAHRAGAVKAYQSSSGPMSECVIGQALEAQAAECDTIAAEREKAAARRLNPDILCAGCHRLRPGPGFIKRDGINTKRLCEECALT